MSEDAATSKESLVPVTGLEVWQLTPEMKQTLDDLSKEVFGSASTWKKLIKKGEIIQDAENKKAKRWVPLTLGEVATRMVIVKEQRDLEAKKAAEAKTQGELNAQSNQEVASGPSVDSAAGATDQSGPAN